MHFRFKSTRLGEPGYPRAFTLVELLVVIAVVALLVSLMLPALAGARKAARGVVCLSGLRSMGQAVVLYCGDHQEQYPLSSHTTGSLAGDDGWLKTLEEYGVSPSFRKCLMDEFREQRLTSYATNEHFEPLVPGLDIDPVTGRPMAGGRERAYDRLGLVPRPTGTVYIYEPAGEGTLDHLHTHRFQTAEDVRAAVAVTRHLGAGHYLFADGHASAWAWADFQAKFSPGTSPFDPETAR